VERYDGFARVAPAQSAIWLNLVCRTKGISPVPRALQYMWRKLPKSSRDVKGVSAMPVGSFFVLGFGVRWLAAGFANLKDV